MQNERIFVKHAAAVGGDARPEILPTGTTAVVLMMPLSPSTGDVAFVVAGKRYQMRLDDFLDSTADLPAIKTALAGSGINSRATSAA